MTAPFPVVDLVSVRRTVAVGDTPLSRKPARMTIVGENVGAVPILVPYAPIGVDHSDLGGEYSFINRPGLPDATAFSSRTFPRPMCAGRVSGFAP